MCVCVCPCLDLVSFFFFLLDYKLLEGRGHIVFMLEPTLILGWKHVLVLKHPNPLRSELLERRVPEGE